MWQQSVAFFAVDAFTAHTGRDRVVAESALLTKSLRILISMSQLLSKYSIWVHAKRHLITVVFSHFYDVLSRF